MIISVGVIKREYEASHDILSQATRWRGIMELPEAGFSEHAICIEM